MKWAGVWRRVARVYACSLGLVLSVGCGEGGEKTTEEPPAPDPAPSQVPDSGTGAPDSGQVVVEPPPDAGPPPVVDSGVPDGGGGNPPGEDGGTDAGTPGNDGGTPGTGGGTDGGTSTPDAGQPPVSSGGPAQRSPQWRASFYAGVAPGGLSVADFNGDGAPDVAVNAMGRAFESRYKAKPGRFLVLLNDGKGVLGKPSWNQRLGTSSGRIAAGDANQDGLVDLLLGTRYGAQLFPGLGGARFATQPSVFSKGVISSLGIWPAAEGSAPRIWAVGSYERSNSGPTTEGGFHLLVPDATGTFESRSASTGSGAPVVAMLDTKAAAAVADFNEDGLMDVVLSSSRWSLTGFFGTTDPSGTQFTAVGLMETSPVLPQPSLLETPDLDGDGHADLVTVEGERLRTYLGRGDGHFDEGIDAPLPAQALASRLVVADADADGWQDVLLVHRDAGLVSFWRGLGQGGLQMAETLATGRAPHDVVVVDLDGDGTRELLVAEAGDNAVSVYAVPRVGNIEPPLTPRCPMVLRDGVAPGTAPRPLKTHPVRPGTQAVTVADFDRNGYEDLALASPSVGVQLVLAQTDGSLRTVDTLRDGSASQLAAGDFNRDGQQDLAVFTADTDRRLRIWWNYGQGDFVNYYDYGYLVEGGAGLLAADVNGDSNVDLVATRHTSCTLAGVLLKNEGGGMLTRTALVDHNSEPDDSCGGGGPPLAADFNGDGTLDLVHQTLGVNLDYVSWAGTLADGEGFSDFSPRYVSHSAGDVDGDGSMDLLLSGEQGTMTVLRGDGGGGLQAPLSCSLKAAGAVLEAKDVNGDGLMDLYGRDTVNPAVVVVPGEGQGRYRTVKRYPLEAKPVWVGPANMLGDARPELVVVLESGVVKVFPAL
ncbi:FG-GAP repeat domain-containing protein [Pyxidicoccus xibeiensis]|uniref:FG-GAP repeat domain-containing protein n=1 Tax=Pyxidicoccus xibeiensis TaxID=2906759 RepID=UPI0020A8013A|nr:VCBS repeat-containing protein [Pyxidicoccus xibeiensis]MCP3138420.1 VCBS repeat-containing protein [Pyxidicoccus xibeiensis]